MLKKTGSIVAASPIKENRKSRAYDFSKTSERNQYRHSIRAKLYRSGR